MGNMESNGRAHIVVYVSMFVCPPSSRCCPIRDIKKGPNGITHRVVLRTGQKLSPLIELVGTGHYYRIIYHLFGLYLVLKMDQLVKILTIFANGRLFAIDGHQMTVYVHISYVRAPMDKLAVVIV